MKPQSAMSSDTGDLIRIEMVSWSVPVQVFGVRVGQPRKDHAAILSSLPSYLVLTRLISSGMSSCLRHPS